MKGSVPMGKRIFVVEDDHTCETILSRIIHSIDPEATIEWKESAETALRVLVDEKKAGRDYDLIIADIYLSGQTTGIELWKLCQELFPGTPILITSGLPINKFFESLGKNSIAPPFLPKPFYIGECQQIIGSLLV